MSEQIFYVMEEGVKHRMGKWKYLFVLDGLIVTLSLGLLIYLKAIYI